MFENIRALPYTIIMLYNLWRDLLSAGLLIWKIRCHSHIELKQSDVIFFFMPACSGERYSFDSVTEEPHEKR